MKLGKYKVKRSYKLVQIVLDVAAAGVLVWIGMLYAALVSSAGEMNQLLAASGADVSISWLPALIWLLPVAVVVLLSLLYTYKSRPLSPKYAIYEHNVQKYYNLTVTMAYVIRFLLLFGLSDYVYIHSMRLLGAEESWFSMQFVFDVILILVAVYHTKSRIKKIEAEKYDNNNDDLNKEYYIVEN